MSLATADALAIPTRLALSFEAADRGVSSAVDPACLSALRDLARELAVPPSTSATAATEGSCVSAQQWTAKEAAEALSLCLVVHERFVQGPASFWAPYLDLVPDGAAAMGAAHWPAAEQRALGLAGGSIEYDDRVDSAAATQIAAATAFADAVFAAALLPLTQRSAIAFPAEACTPEALRWALACWRSRAMAPRGSGLGDSGQLQHGALLPGCDFFNHACGALSSFRSGTLPRARPRDVTSGPAIACSWTSGTAEAAIVVTLPGALAVSTCAELLINYGAKESAAFACFYGFLPLPLAATARLQLGSSRGGADGGTSSVMLIKHAPPPEALLAHAAAEAARHLDPGNASGRIAPYRALVRMFAAAAASARCREDAARLAPGVAITFYERRALAVELHEASRSVLEWHRQVAANLAECAPASELPQVATCVLCSGDRADVKWFDEAIFFEAAAALDGTV
jgi:hypothetical protein